MRFASIRLADGPLIHYAEEGATRDEPVVLLHGWPDSWFSYSRLVPLLPEGSRRIVPDQRGFGDSERPERGYSMPDLAHDVVALLDALSIDRATLVGHSMGTFVARRAAIAYPDRVRRLVLIGSGWSTRDNSVLHEVEEGIRDLPDPVPLDFAREFQASTIHKPIPEEFFEGLLAEAVKLPARLWREVFRAIMDYDDVADLGRIVAPTLLLWGDRDALFPRQDQERLAEAIPGATLKIYPDIGHCPNWESPEQVAADIAAFMRSA